MGVHIGTDLPSKAQQEARNTYIMEELKPVIVIADRAVDGDWVTAEELIELGRRKGDFTIPRGRDLILGLHFTGGGLIEELLLWLAPAYNRYYYDELQ